LFLKVFENNLKVDVGSVLKFLVNDDGRFQNYWGLPFYIFIGVRDDILVFAATRIYLRHVITTRAAIGIYYVHRNETTHAAVERHAPQWNDTHHNQRSAPQ
jgi:hypothetical protein